MKILINASNIKIGGGIQVTDSLCRSLSHFCHHQFIVILSSSLLEVEKKISDYSNVTVLIHNIRNSFSTLFFGRDSFLDRIIRDENVDCVYTVFGPSRWNPLCLHISGFARPHLIYPESPYYKQLSIKDKVKSYWTNFIVSLAFRRSTHIFVSENEWVSMRVEKCFKGSKCYTISNYYNQVFDREDEWQFIVLPPFVGVTLLYVGANYPHKNLKILIEVAEVMCKTHPDLNFRFVLTLSPNELSIPIELREHFVFVGNVDISQCPSLYKQADIMIQPSLLECFSATYPEAMRMGVPIVTTDLDFAKALCGDAACYFSAIDAVSAADAISHIAKDKDYAARLIAAGKEQLKKYDNYEMRAEKLISLLEDTASNIS